MLPVLVNLWMLGAPRGQGSGPSKSNRGEGFDVYTTDKDLLNLVNLILMSGVIENG